ncbi:MAG: FKBP-type peptidyl-prolyl cis-trans isomerase, partial [Bacillota bacterium]|nr:FKBP-type peptidyl-prolyl cis-trans isomerase [Bacillota bacterium]
MTQAQNGNTVKVHYTGKLENGEIFDSSEGRDPLEFTIG